MSELSLGQIKGLPVNSNVVTVPSGHTLYAPGHVIQTVQFATTSNTSTTSTSFINTVMTTSITPKFASSKILVLVDCTLLAPGSNNIYFTLYRGTVSGTNLGNGTNGFGNSSGAGGDTYTRGTLTYLDSPNTTSSTQYMFAIRVTGGTGAVNNINNVGTITLLEIAA